MFATAPAAEAHPFAGGAGTQGDPYQIKTLNQLQAVGESVYLTSHFILMNDIPAAETATWHETVIVGVYNGFDPIGDMANRFTGHFNGNGRVITDLHIHRPTEDRVGLFGYVGSGGTTANVGVEGGTITGRNWTGGLVGRNDGTITDSYATGTVTGTNRVGGLVGWNWGGAITNSYATGTVSGTGTGIVGGLVGQNDSDATITDSYATGTVSGTTNAGGLVGVNSGIVNGSFWDTDTSGWSTSAGGAGKTTAEMQQSSTFTGWDYTNVWQQVTVIGVTLDQTSFSLVVGGSPVTLVATVLPPGDITYPYFRGQTINLPVVAAGKNVTWTSSDTAIATVDASGVVTPLSAGTATITVTTNCGSFTANSAVNVTVPVTGVSVTPAILDLVAGGATGTLVATVTPNNATDKTVAWSSSDTAIATVDASGVVTAAGAGTATITVTTNCGSFTANSAVNVTVPVTGVSVTPAILDLVAGGATGTLVATVTPTNATDQTVTWSSNDTTIATVANGVVTPLVAGTTTITVTTVCGSKIATSTVTVSAAGGTPGGGGGDRDDDPAPKVEEQYEDVSEECKEQLEDLEAGAELQIKVGAKDLPPALDYETVQALVENQSNPNVAFEEAKADLHFTPEALWTDELQAAGAGTLVGLSATILEGEDARAAANFAVGIGGEVLRAYDLSVTVIADTGDTEGTPVHHLNGDVTITLDLSDLDLTAIDPNQLTIQHQQPDGTWRELESTFDPETKTLTFTTDRFSLFAVVEKPAAPGSITLTIGQTAADVYGTPYILDAVPYIQAGTGRTMIPLRFVSEALGAEVDWQAETRQVLIKDGATEIVLTIDSDRVLINGTPATLDCRAELKPPGRTFVPLRFISETLGAQVDYDEQTKQITITRH